MDERVIYPANFSLLSGLLLLCSLGSAWSLDLSVWGCREERKKTFRFGVMGLVFYTSTDLEIDMGGNKMASSYTRVCTILWDHMVFFVLSTFGRSGCIPDALHLVGLLYHT
ncbi:hypothetical protein F5Y17DRAFT_436922, partial [Xylariaceae sp. FL0594]